MCSTYGTNSVFYKIYDKFKILRNIPLLYLELVAKRKIGGLSVLLFLKPTIRLLSKINLLALSSESKAHKSLGVSCAFLEAE